MIIDLKRFVEQERPLWRELEGMLSYLENEPIPSYSLEQIKRLHYLYERTCSDLAKVSGYSKDNDLVHYLQSLVARAYGEIHEERARRVRFRPLHWFFRTFPQTFRRRARYFWISLAAMFVGALFGGFALMFDRDAKHNLIPPMFAAHLGSPSDRVAAEESAGSDEELREHGSFAGFLMVNNTKAAIQAMAFGMSWGILSLVVLFYNGVILGVVSADYILDGQSVFLAAWLLPHGSVELPAIIMGGQCGLLLGAALIGWGSRENVKDRLRSVLGDLSTLIGGVAVLLVWAGFVESFFSQHHEPRIAYTTKIAFGLIELALLILFLWRMGRPAEIEEEAAVDS